MFCNKCGIANPISARYCHDCGAALPIFSSSPSNPDFDEDGPARKSRRAPTPRSNFIARHWRGDYSLAFSYWVMGSFVTFTVAVSTLLIGSSSSLGELGPRASGIAILIFFTLVGALTIWQIVGIWRSSDKHRQRGGKIFWAVLAKIVVVLGITGMAVDFNTRGVPLVSEGADLALGIDNTPPHQIRLLRDGSELELAGGMPYGTNDAVKRFLDAAPAIRVIHLNSQGGRMREAYQLHKTIKKRNLITFTSAECVSACSFAFLAGRERYLGERARLGFHSVSLRGLSDELAKELNEGLRQAMQAHGVPERFISRALSTSASDMWYPTNDELLEAKIIDAVVDSRYFALSGISQWRDAHKIEAEFLTVPVYSALAQYDQQNYARLRDIWVSGIQRGRSQTEIQNEVRSVLLEQIIPAYLKKAPDEALIRYWNSQIAEMKHLANVNPRACADFAFPQFAISAPDLQRLLPQDMVTADLNALEGVVKGVATTPQGHDLTPEVEADLEALLQRVAVRDPLALQVIQDPAVHKDDPASLCGAVLALYSEVLAIPSGARSGALLRYMLSE